MRAGPLSEPYIIQLLNSYFVPVYTTNEDYREPTIRVSTAERDAYQRIYREADEENRDVGTVCVYLIAPDGDGLDSLIVSEAARTEKLAAMLEAAVQKLNVQAGEPLVAPQPQSVAPAAAEDAFVLHLISRYNRRGGWADFPSENWIVMQPERYQKWLPDKPAQVELSWEIDPAIAAEVLTHFYPQTEVCHFDEDILPDGPHQHRIEELWLEGKVLHIEQGIALARLDGRVQLKHTFYPDKEDDKRAVSSVVGLLEFDVNSKTIQSFKLISGEGDYGGDPFNVVVQKAET